MPIYSQINWDKAACKDTYTDLFYSVEEERSILQYDYINALRSICAACPLWKECLTYGFEHENYGVWGGLTSVERASMQDKSKYPNQRFRALESMSEFGISFEQIKECM